MTPYVKNLSQLLRQVKEARLANESCLAVFDLDSTLFDVGPRLEKILYDFSQDSDAQKKYPYELSHFSLLEIKQKDWGLQDALMRAGLDGKNLQFEKDLKQFWRKRFFSNEYLEYDVPYLGACAFVRALHDVGCEIVYLTGRDVARMGKGSATVLKKWDFPLDEKATLVLKPVKEMDDAEFKKDWFCALPEQKFSKILFFENEPVNINLIRKELPHLEIYFFDSTHSKLENPPSDIPWIVNFIHDMDDECSG